MKRTNVLGFFARRSALGPRSVLVLLTTGFLSLILVGVVQEPAGAQTIYKYTDKNGAVVLTDKPPQGVHAEPIVTGKPGVAAPSGEQQEAAGPSAPPGSVTAEEIIRQRDQQLDEAMKSVERREKEREIERQRRLQEAERLEAEARKPVPATRENLQRQYELMQEAEKLRRAE
jgi:hypothetical protein